MFSASTTYEKQLRIEKTRLSHQVWSHGGSTFKKNMTLNGHFSRPAETDPYVYQLNLRVKFIYNTNGGSFTQNDINPPQGPLPLGVSTNEQHKSQPVPASSTDHPGHPSGLFPIIIIVLIGLQRSRWCVLNAVAELRIGKRKLNNLQHIVYC